MEAVSGYLLEMWTEKQSSMMIDYHIRCVERVLSKTVDQVEAELGVFAGPIGGVESSHFFESGSTHDQIDRRQIIAFSSELRRVSEAQRTCSEKR